MNGVITGWIRPVSARASREISEDERRYERGGGAQLYDKVSISFRHAQLNSRHQSENLIIDERFPWEFIERATWDEVERSLDWPVSLWLPNCHTRHGQNDKVPEELLVGIRRSLEFVRVPAMVIRVYIEPGFNGAQPRRRVRGRFVYGNLQYDLSVTDPAVEAEFLPKEEGNYDVGEVLACVSLAEPFHGFAFKVLASISNRRRYNGHSLLG